MTHRPTAGTRIGAYIVRSRVAIGGMAEVYVAAEQRSAGSPREVVIKRLLPQLATDPEALRMFEDEARLGARIVHPNVARVLGSGMDSGQPYLVLELVPGVDLWRLLRFLRRSEGVLGIELAIHVACGLLRGLVAVHEATDEDGVPLHIVHQDVSPSNLLLSTFGDVKLSDLGIARTRLRDHFGATPTGDGLRGKLGYFAPEQVNGRAIDQRSDVFSAAVVISELLLGRPLFAGSSELDILLAIRDGEIGPLLDLAPTLPDGLSDVLIAALARDPEARTQTSRALLIGIERFLPNDTTPTRQDLGAIVARAALEGASVRSGIPGAGELVHVATPTLRTAREALPPELFDDEDGEADRRTIELDPTSYELPDGEAGSGPSTRATTSTSTDTSTSTSTRFSYAQMVEKIATGGVRANAEIRVDGSVTRPLASIEVLARHLPKSGSDAPLGTIRFSVADGGFARAFLRVVFEQRTGVFVCKRASERKEIALHDGIPSFVGSNLAAEMLGEFLVARAVISRGELDMALAVMPRFDGHLGDTLIALGLIEPVQLFRHIEVQVRERMLDLFTWTEGQGRFDPGVSHGSPFPPESDVAALIDEGLRRRILAGLDRELVTRGLGSRLILREPLPPGLTSTMVGKPERLLLARARSPARGADLLEDLARDIGGDRPRAARALLLLHHAGVLEFMA